MSTQDLRSFVRAYGEAHPSEVVTVREPVSLEHDIMALVLEYERRRRWPILLFEQVAGHDIPIIANVVASRRALAFALGVAESALAAEYARRIKDPIKPVGLAEAPFRERVLTGEALDLRALPIPLYFPATPAAISRRGCSSPATPRPAWRRRATIASSSRGAIASG